MTRDKGYPDWLVLSPSLLVQPSCGQVKIVQNICFGRVPLWLCEDITACCYMYCYFCNTLNNNSEMRRASGPDTVRIADPFRKPRYSAADLLCGLFT